MRAAAARSDKRGASAADKGDDEAEGDSSRRGDDERDKCRRCSAPMRSAASLGGVASRAGTAADDRLGGVSNAEAAASERGWAWAVGGDGNDGEGDAPAHAGRLLRATTRNRAA